jgi:SAM-dependent methyltransferase
MARGNFDVNLYWLARGKTYFQEGRLKTEYYHLQEQFLLNALTGSGLPTNNIVELGCGFGRITRLLAEAFPRANVVALDLSPDQLERAAENCANVRNVTFRQYDVYSGAPVPGGSYDLAIAIEVLLHHPHDTVVDMVRSLSSAASCFVNLDWSENWKGERPQHVWIHDYSAIYRGLGLSHVALPLPWKIDGMQQQLFVASRVVDLGASRLASVDEWSQSVRPNLRPVEGASFLSSPFPGADDWSERVGAALTDLRICIPARASFVLVDDAQWESGQPLGGRRAIPFLEREGQYWGPPPDDETAIRELERLRTEGASHIVFAWPAFWWLDYYRGFRQYLEVTYPRVLVNDRLVAFALRASG